MFDSEACNLVTGATPTAENIDTSKGTCFIKSQGTQTISSRENIVKLAKAGDQYIISTNAGGPLNTLTVKSL